MLAVVGKRSWKDALIALLGLAVVLLLAGRVLEWRSEKRAQLEAAGELVEVFDVLLDREGQEFVDFFFDRDIGKAGEILSAPPATVDPPLAGVWRWRDDNVLRFEPSGGFELASEYRIELIPDRLTFDGSTLAGDTGFSIRTDEFILESVSVEEELAPEGAGAVVFRGTASFNYAVKAEQLAPLIALRDPDGPDGDTVEVSLERAYGSRGQISFRSGAVNKGRDERVLELVIDGSLTPAAGNVPLGEDFVEAIPLGAKGRLTVRRITSQPGLEESTLQIDLSSPVDAEIARRYLTVEPDLEYRLSAQRNVLRLTGAFPPGSEFEIELAGGLPAKDEAVLPATHKESGFIGHLAPSLDFQSQGMFLSASGYRTVGLDTVNVDRFRMNVDRVHLNNLFSLFAYEYGVHSQSTYGGSTVHHALGDRVAEEVIEVRAERNTKATTPLILDRFLPEGEPGLYRVMVGRDGEWSWPQRWLLITDIGLVTKHGEGGLLVWASSFRDLRPIAGARVTVLSDQNQRIASGLTDSRGVWRFQDADALAEDRPFLVTVERGDDFSFVLLDRMGIDTTGLDVGGARPSGQGYTAFLYGERDLYRPGEEVEGLAVVRDGRLRAAPAMPALLRHLDPRGIEVEEKRVTIEAGGTSELSFGLPAYALTGHHTLELEVAEKVIGRYPFQVEEFIPDRIKVEIGEVEEPAGPGDNLRWDVTSTYLFGPPAAGLLVESRVRLSAAPFSHPRYSQFSFADPDREFDNREIFSSEAHLDGEGRFAFETGIPDGLTPPSGLAADITVRVQEQGGRGVTARARRAVHPWPYYLGLRRLGEGYAELNQEAELEFVALAPDGSATAAGELEASFYYDRWQTVLRRTAAGGFRYQSTRDPRLVARQTLQAGSRSGSFRFTPQEYGQHRVVLADPATGASTSVRFYVSGWGYSPWAVENPARIELDLDAEEYRPGETATLQVRAPFAGKLLLTIERDGVLAHGIHTLEGNTATIPIPVRAEFRPNVYVTATLVRPVTELEEGSVGRAFGSVPLFVDREANRLPVEISAADQARSSSTLDIEVTTAPGATVTLAAVDEGILQLTNQQTADPFSFFYRKLALGVTSADNFSLLLPELSGTTAPGGGVGAGGLGQFVRTEGIRRVQPVAFWSGPIQAGANGRARTSFAVPEFQGALRIMAVAFEGRRFGSVERFTRIRDPLNLLPTLPRVLSFEEKLEVPVTVRNDTGEEAEIRIGLQVSGPAGVAGGSTQTLRIADGTEKPAYFTVRTEGRAGEVEFRFSAEGGGETARATARVGVRADLPPIAIRKTGSQAEPRLELPFEDGGGFREGSVSRELRIGALPLFQFAGNLEGLLRYPYGCLEQTVSRALPLIYLGDLAERLAPDLLDSSRAGLSPREGVEAGVARIGRMQLANGGFSLWAGGGSHHPWSSIYATHFLVEARSGGYLVPSHTYDRAVAFLGGLVKAKSKTSSKELARMVYALWVLSRADRPDVGTMDFLREKHFEALRPESKALLAAAYSALGNPRAVEELVARITDAEKIERETGGNFDSTIRNRALLLMALLDGAPNSPLIPQLVERLAADRRNSPRWTTQESAFALTALGRFFHRQAERPPYSGKVYAGRKLLGTFSSDADADFAGITGDGPLRIEMDEGYEPGSVYFTLFTRGIPSDRGFAPASEGLEIETKYLDRAGQEIDLASVRQGDLLIIRTRARSLSGPVQNAALQLLLPAGLEVENPRLESTETMPWITSRNTSKAVLDLRDDRILLFTDLPANSWQKYHSLVRAVVPGEFRVPPAQIEAMYNPALRATGERARLEVGRR